MNRDPYDVLGIPRNSSAEEVKKAYRMLSRQYHPDAHINSPSAKMAEEKFKEIQEAYENIQSGRFGGFYGYSDYRSYGNSTDYNLNSIAMLIRAGNYEEAINQLDQFIDRTAEWYYLAAIAHIGCGYVMKGKIYARTAYQMNPDHEAYRQLVEQIEGRTEYYGTQTFSTDKPTFNACGTTCLSNLCLCMLCNRVFCCC